MVSWQDLKMPSLILKNCCNSHKENWNNQKTFSLLKFIQEGENQQLRLFCLWKEDEYRPDSQYNSLREFLGVFLLLLDQKNSSSFKEWKDKELFLRFKASFSPKNASHNKAWLKIYYFLVFIPALRMSSDPTWNGFLREIYFQ